MHNDKQNNNTQAELYRLEDNLSHLQTQKETLDTYKETLKAKSQDPETLLTVAKRFVDCLSLFSYRLALDLTHISELITALQAITQRDTIQACQLVTASNLLKQVETLAESVTEFLSFARQLVKQ